MDVERLTAALRVFAAERDWHRFHTPKNLATAATVEAAELLEIFQWLTAEESRALTDDQRRHVRQEIADILIYVIMLADLFDIDVEQAVVEKIEENRARYPAGASKGRATRLALPGA